MNDRMSADPLSQNYTILTLLQREEPSKSVAMSACILGNP